MKAKIYLLLALLVCSGMLVTITSASPTESSVTLSSSGVVQQPPATTYSYIIRVSGSNYQMTDGTTGQIDYQSTKATQVINAAIGNLTQGGSILFSAGTYNLNGSITGENKGNITLAFENGATLFVANGMNKAAIVLTGCSNWLIQNPTINGNAANQAVGGGSRPHGIEIVSSNNCQVDGAYIYNCRLFGFYTFSNAVHNGITNSKIFNCGWNGMNLGGDANEYSNYAIHNEVAYCSDVGITSYGFDNVIQDNYVHDMNGTTGYGGGTRWGIGVEGGGNTTITGNHVVNCEVGIKFDYDENGAADGNSNSNTASSNRIEHCLTAGMEIYSDYNTVSDNEFLQWDYASTWKNAITIGGDNNLISGNTLNSTFSTSVGVVLETGSNNEISSNDFITQAGVQVHAGVTNTIIRNNDFSLCRGTKISDSGTGTTIIGNLGYP